ncbi:RxLR effector protein 24 [Phytophthora ramorum]|uniref:RxLR effector protein 24 n=1 Tax=Phytophthora ramorum TaxID=164328 RepID=UPI0030A2F839|nr:RxLR effector protein 24 [Phytophthora ramorum]
MRLLLWVLLVTLVTLLASADAESSKIANVDTPATSKLGSIEAPAPPARALSPEYTADGKRSLRVHGNDDDATDDNGGNELYTREDEEERAMSISSILDNMKTYLGGWTNIMSASVNTQLYKWVDDLAMRLYKRGVTPTSFKARNLGFERNKASVEYYKAWYDNNVAAGVIKALE